MTAIERVRRTQGILGVVALTHALAWGLAATLLIVAAVSFLRNDSTVPVIVAAVLGIGLAAVLMWRARHLASPSRVALWIEERIPDLQYTLVTAMEQSGSPFVDDIERAAARQDINTLTRAALRRAGVPLADANYEIQTAAFLLLMMAAATLASLSRRPALAALGWIWLALLGFNCVAAIVMRLLATSVSAVEARLREEPSEL